MSKSNGYNGMKNNGGGRGRTRAKPPTKTCDTCSEMKAIKKEIRKQM